jgi:hypothetical protein
MRSAEKSALLRSLRRGFSVSVREAAPELVASCRAGAAELRTSPRGKSVSLAWSAFAIPNKATATTMPLISHHLLRLEHASRCGAMMHEHIG